MASIDYSPLQQWLYWPDTIPLDVFYATAGHISFSGDPLWLIMIGPSGSGKTELIRSLSDHYRTMNLDNWSPKAFISGYVNGGNVDLLARMNEKLMLVKDLTGILGSSRDTARELLDQLRGMYDGYWDRATGTGSKGYKAKFGLIAGCTPALDAFRSISVSLGDRFLRIEWAVEEGEIARKSQEMSGRKDEMRAGITAFSTQIMNDMLERWPDYNNVQLPYLNQLQINQISWLVSMLRTAVMRDFRDKVLYMPVPDAGGRVATNLTELTKSLMCLKQEAIPSDETMQAVVRVGEAMLPLERRLIMRSLYQGGGWMDMKAITAASRVSYRMALTEVDDLWQLGMVAQSGGKPNLYRISDYLEEMLRISPFPFLLPEQNMVEDLASYREQKGLA